MTGSHHILLHEDGRRVTLPRHSRTVKTWASVGSAKEVWNKLGGILGEAVNERSYLIIVHPDEEGGFWTEVPALPGCGSQGETLDEAIEMTKDAILGFIESLKKQGVPVPQEGTVAVTVTVAA